MAWLISKNFTLLYTHTWKPHNFQETDLTLKSFVECRYVLYQRYASFHINEEQYGFRAVVSLIGNRFNLFIPGPQRLECYAEIFEE